MPIAAVHHLGLEADGSAAAKKFLEDSEPWYAAVRNSEPSPATIETFPWQRSDPPEEPGLSQVAAVRSQWYANQIAGSFLFRAAMHFRAGNFTHGLDDLQIVYKAARNCEKHLLTGYRRSLKTEERANAELINGLVLCPSIDEHAAHQLTQSPVVSDATELVRMLDQQHRFAALDFVQFFHHHPTTSLTLLNSVRAFGRYRTMARRYAAHRLDFDELLRFQNQLIDQVCAAMSKPTYREQRDSLATLRDDARSSAKSATADFSFFTHDFQPNANEQLTFYGFLQELPRDFASVVNSRRVLHLAVRLARWRTIHGHYPDSLDVLNSVPGLPPLPECVLIDAFSDEPFRYERVGERYRIQAVGEFLRGNVIWPVRFLLPESTRP